MQSTAVSTAEDTRGQSDRDPNDDSGGMKIRQGQAAIIHSRVWSVPSRERRDW